MDSLGSRNQRTAGVGWRWELKSGKEVAGVVLVESNCEEVETRTVALRHSGLEIGPSLRQSWNEGPVRLCGRKSRS